MYTIKNKSVLQKLRHIWSLFLRHTYEFEGEIRIFNGAVILSDKLILYLGFVFMCTGTTTTYVQVRKALFYCIRNTCMYRKSECIFNNIFKQYFLTIFLDILWKVSLFKII